MAVFQSVFKCDTTGGIVRVPTDCPEVVVIQVDSVTSKGSRMEYVPITGYTLELSTNHQFLHTLNDFIYAFAFGDRVGELTLTGIAFTAPACKAEGGNISNEVKQENVYEFYLAQKFSKTLTPTKIKIGGSDIRLVGFLTGVRMSVPDPQLPIMQWALRFSVIVDTNNSAPASTAGGSAANTPGAYLDNALNVIGTAVDDAINTIGNTTVGDILNGAGRVLTETFFGEG